MVDFSKYGTPIAEKPTDTGADFSKYGAPISDASSAPIITPQTATQKAGSVIDAIFGGGKIGEAIGTGIGYTFAPAEEKKYYDTSIPSAGQLGGSALQSASLFTPVGRVAGLATKALTRVGLKTGAKVLGNIASGALAGEAFDTASNLQQGKTGTEALKPGLNTAIGGSLPVVGPVLKGATRLGAESLGVSTGAGYGAIKELFNASAKGGVEKKAALDALRGNTSPEQIVQEAKGALDSIKTSRSQAYTTALSKLKESTKSYDISPIIDSVKQNMDKFGVHVQPNGVIDFSRSPIRFDSTAQADIAHIVDTMKDFGSRAGDRTVTGLDSLKRAFGDLYSPSGESRAFVTSVKNSVSDILKEVPGYSEMAANYGEKSQLINDIQKSLSLGGKANIDTAFKKLTTVLRTNNEERKVLVDELNGVSGGKLVPMIAGQQMNELLPRGLARQIEGFGAIGSIMAGFGAPLIKLALFASPRVVGEFVNALGIGKLAGNKLLDTLGIKGVKLISPGDRLLQTKTGQKVEQGVKDFVKEPKMGLSMKDVSGISPELQPLAEEARKYKSAEEFSNSLPVGGKQGRDIGRGLGYYAIENKKPISDSTEIVTVWRGIPKGQKTSLVDGDYVSLNKNSASSYGQKVDSFQVPKNKLYGAVGKDDLIFHTGLENGKTKSQLIDLYNKAVGKK